jgi:CRP/FNR family transcriptional activator FtrB
MPPVSSEDQAAPPRAAPAVGSADPPVASEDALRQAPIFRDLADSVVRALARIASVSDVPADSVLCRQNAPSEHLHVLLRGQVALFNAAPDGSTAVVEVIRPPGHFVLATVLARLPYLLSAKAVAPSRLIRIEADGLHALLPREPGLAVALMQAEAEDFRDMVRQVCDLKLRTTAQRLGCYLLELTKDSPNPTAQFRLPFDKRLLAARLGCRQENLSRAFAALRNLGVETHGSRVMLHDIARLRAYSVPDEEPA